MTVFDGLAGRNPPRVLAHGGAGRVAISDKAAQVTLDKSFGGDGKRTTDFSGAAPASSAVHVAARRRID
jgi:hypothetical protein